MPYGPLKLAAGVVSVDDVDLRVAVGPKGYLMAQVLKLPAFFDWYPTVEHALRVALLDRLQERRQHARQQVARVVERQDDADRLHPTSRARSRRSPARTPR